jgi:hypothetical protein
MTIAIRCGGVDLYAASFTETSEAPPAGQISDAGRGMPSR